MSSPLLLFLLLISSFSHASNARHLAAIHGDPLKGMENHDGAMSSSKPKEALLSGVGLRQETKDGKEGFNKVQGASVTTKGWSLVSKTSAKAHKKKKNQRASSGDHDKLLLSSHMGLHQKAQLEGIRRQAQSAVGPRADSSNCSVMGEARKVSEDVVTMDYEPPQSTPPIHHLSP